MFVERQLTILHADLDAFFASVEQRDDPRLRCRPVIVGAGVVMAASYEARACGVRSAMGGARARRLCPQAIVVQPRWQAYVEASAAVFAIFERTAPIVERVSIDEAFLDVRGLHAIAGSPVQIATGLRQAVREQAGLPISVGVATTKVLAKLASAMAKPDGLLVVDPGDELAFLHPLAVQRLWGVGPATAEKLHGRGIRSVGDLAQAGEPALMALLGRAAGRHLYAVAHNRGVERVQARRRRRSFGSQRALGRSELSPDELDAALSQVHARDRGPAASEPDEVRPNAYPNLEQPLATCPREIRVVGDERLQLEAAAFDLVEVVSRAFWCVRVHRPAWLRLPELTDAALLIPDHGRH